MPACKMSDRDDPSVEVARREHSEALRRTLIDAGVLRPGELSGLQMDHGTVLPIDEAGRVAAAADIQRYAHVVAKAAPGNDELMRALYSYRRAG